MEEEKPQCWNEAAVPCMVRAVLPLCAAACCVHPANPSIPAASPFLVRTEEQASSRAGKQPWPEERSKGAGDIHIEAY